MSKQEHVIRVIPPEYQSANEVMTFRNYQCPVCHGRGSFRPEQIGFDEWKTDTCKYCDGTGKVKADVNINWSPDYE